MGKVLQPPKLNEKSPSPLDTLFPFTLAHRAESMRVPPPFYSLDREPDLSSVMPDLMQKMNLNRKPQSAYFEAWANDENKDAKGRTTLSESFSGFDIPNEQCAMFKSAINSEQDIESGNDSWSNSQCNSQKSSWTSQLHSTDAAYAEMVNALTTLDLGVNPSARDLNHALKARLDADPRSAEKYIRAFQVVHRDHLKYSDQGNEAGVRQCYDPYTENKSLGDWDHNIKATTGKMNTSVHYGHGRAITGEQFKPLMEEELSELHLDASVGDDEWSQPSEDGQDSEWGTQGVYDISANDNKIKRGWGRDKPGSGGEIGSVMENQDDDDSDSWTESLLWGACSKASSANNDDKGQAADEWKSHTIPPPFGFAVKVECVKAPILDKLSVTYHATITSGQANLKIPIHAKSVWIHEQDTIKAMTWLWKWLVAKDIADRISLEDIYELAKTIVHPDLEIS